MVDQKIEITVLDILGQELKSEVYTLSSDSEEITWYFSQDFNLKNGFYLVKFK
jgi:hypothetical protein